LTRAVPASEKDILCAQGRFGYAGVHDGDRLLTATVNRGKDRKETSVPDALNFAAEKLRAVINSYGTKSVAVYVAENMTSEEGRLLKTLPKRLSVHRICLPSASTKTCD
jgi:predicted molibdopterin-dependent oxidoreductase YjgC